MRPLCTGSRDRAMLSWRLGVWPSVWNAHAGRRRGCDATRRDGEGGSRDWPSKVAGPTLVSVRPTTSLQPTNHIPSTRHHQKHQPLKVNIGEAIHLHDLSQVICSIHDLYLSMYSTVSDAVRRRPFKPPTIVASSRNVVRNVRLKPPHPFLSIAPL